MFIGHNAVAFAAKKAAPGASLGALMSAAMLADLIGPLFLFLAALYVVSAAATPPPNARVLAWGALSAWLLPLWAWWFDRHRVPMAT